MPYEEEKNLKGFNPVIQKAEKSIPLQEKTLQERNNFKKETTSRKKQLQERKIPIPIKV
ncbi:MAG: hypothetical protein AB3K77_06710 [Methanosarcinaceae archaeon]